MKWLLIVLIVIQGTIADVLNTMGMKRNGEVSDFRPRAFLRLIASLIRNPYVVIGVPAGGIVFCADGTALDRQPELCSAGHRVQLCAGDGSGKVHPERTHRLAALRLA